MIMEGINTNNIAQIENLNSNSQAREGIYQSILDFFPTSNTIASTIEKWLCNSSKRMSLGSIMEIKASKKR